MTSSCRTERRSQKRPSRSFRTGGAMTMSNSALVSYTKLSPNRSSRNGQRITKITPHHMAGNLTVETCGDIFEKPANEASANYGIGTDGRIALYVPEDKRAWTSANGANVRLAVTIEVANCEVGGDWRVSDAAWSSLVDLCVDICRRNGISGLSWTGDASGSLTCHYMFASTACPGPYLKGRMGQLAEEVNARLAGETPAQGASGQASAGKGFGGTYRCTVSELNVRDAPTLGGNVVASYRKGQTVILDDWYVSRDGYIWGRYTGAQSGRLRYIAVGRATGKPEPDDYLVKT